MIIVNLKKIGSFAGLKKIGGIYCGRPSALGNPFVGNNAIPQYETWLAKQIVEQNPKVVLMLQSLQPNSILGCWCAPLGCHCEIIAKYYFWTVHNQAVVINHRNNITTAKPEEKTNAD